VDLAQQNNHEQSLLWNGIGGEAWVELQDLLDSTFKPIEELLADEISAAPDCRVLDVGCGTGATTLAVAQRLGAKGFCVGVDISAPMLAAARTRAEKKGAHAAFILADAQDHAFEPASFDRIMSRFGVMFFSDVVRAFTNLRRAAKDGAEMRLAVYRSPAENPFMITAEGAAGSLLPNLPPRQPNAPGQFAFADQHRLQRILEESGWAEINIRPIDVACALPEKELVRYFTRLGPLGRILPETDEPTRSRVIETVRASFDPFVHGADVRFNAACWMVGARAVCSSAGPKETARAGS